MMVVANEITRERRLKLEQHNIEPREIPAMKFRAIAEQVGYVFVSEQHTARPPAPLASATAQLQPPSTVAATAARSPTSITPLIQALIDRLAASNQGANTPHGMREDKKALPIFGTNGREFMIVKDVGGELRLDFVLGRPGARDESSLHPAIEQARAAGLRIPPPREKEGKRYQVFLTGTDLSDRWSVIADLIRAAEYGGRQR